VYIKVDNVSNSTRVFATSSEHKVLIELDPTRNLNLYALIHVKYIGYQSLDDHSMYYPGGWP
jgi:hypothetical protein